jgi:hypothetical protein
MSGSPTNTSNTKANGTKRTLDGQVKREPNADQADQLQPQQPADAVPRPAHDWDYHRISVRGDKITKTIRDFQLAFLLSGDDIPVVLHFPLRDWTTAFKTTLLDLGLDDDAAMNQVHTSLSISLAMWAKNVAVSKTAKALGLNERWLVEPLVKEGVRLGYFSDEHQSLDKIIRTANTLHALEQ